MSKRPLAVVSILALLVSACTKQPSAKMTLGAGKRFVPQVVDSVTDVGRSPSIAVDADGNPIITYLGFDAIAKAGEIPESRPVTLPLVPGVMTAGLADGRWAVSGVEAPDEKLTAADDKGATIPLDSAATSSVLDSKGNLHVVWVDAGGLKYAAGSGGRYTVETVGKGTDFRGPAVAVDAAGNPWVSYYQGGAVMVAAMSESGWTSAVVAKPGSCDKYCAETRTAIVAAKEGPVVAYRDGGAVVAMPSADDPAIWTPMALGDAGGGLGIAMAVTKGGDPVISYMGTSGEVKIASYDAGAFSVTDVSSVEMESSNWVTTGVAVDDSGVRYVAWYDPKADRVKFAGESGGDFVEVATPGTDGGGSPSLAVARDGSAVWLAWYDHENGNLQAGSYGLQDVVLAEASPLPELSLPAEAPSAPPAPESSASTIPGGPAGPATSAGKTFTLKLVAPAGSVASGFDKTKLSAPANTAIDLEFDNQDPGVPHNVEIWTADPLKDPSATAIFTPDGGATITGPDQVTYSVPPMDAGTYFYRCLVHPTTMTGTLTVK